MNLYEIKQAIANETDEARISELIMMRDALRAEEKKAASSLSSDEAYARMLDYTHN